MPERLSCSLVPGKARLKGGGEKEVWLGSGRDRGLLLDLFSRLSEDTVLLRFLRPIKYWEPVVDEILGNARLVILAGAVGLEAVASAEAYDTGIRGVAELGIVVRDDLQGRGLGTVLTALTGLCLLENGYRALEAYFDPFNIPMRRIMVDKLGSRVVGQGRDMVFTRLDLEPNRERMLRVLEGRYTPAAGAAQA
jgi:RimJ/RimL family protein N-acetyltransferase